MLISLDRLQKPEIEIGELLTVVVVNSANMIKDIQSNIKDMLGGRMKHYEKTIQDALDIALQELEQKARNRGYDGVIGVKIVSPTVVNGGAEVVVYGNGFKTVNSSQYSAVDFLHASE
jgi:uncharacterized protein YbjQ (UPF0145 family)